MENMETTVVVLLICAFLFFIGSMVGWVIELFYRRFFSDKNPERRWINPGFLVGPYLPLYGFGLQGLFLMSFIPYIGVDSLEDITWVQVIICILAMGVMMTLIEYIAGIIFIKHMHVKLWDYTTQWGNIQGIICPKFSAIWTILGAIYYFFINPHVLKMVIWYNNNIAFTFIVGVFFGIFFVDLGYSLNVGYKIRRYANDLDIIVKYEELKEAIQRNAERTKNKTRFLVAFASELPLKEQIKLYSDNLLETAVEIKNSADEIRETLVNDIRETIDDIKNSNNKEE